MNHNDELDNILDQALSEYRDAEPLAGFESRLLHRMQTQPLRQSWPHWIAAAIAAMVVVAVSLVVWKHSATPPTTTLIQESASVTQPAKTAGGAKSAESRSLAENRRTRIVQRVPARSADRKSGATGSPELAEFPAPSPLSPEEHALLALARAHPDALLNQPDATPDVTIPPIEIKLLPDLAGQSEGEN